ncbi:hypothetical protein M0R45_035950 [Rubus argutus]|uniref:HAUS augmin-like complex subunit 3 N-terminal domain-containing protein n=1 Tax=Rubus argutus TaxID=59490 RepID=A0AAW1VW48_RUBAR
MFLSILRSPLFYGFDAWEWESCGTPEGVTATLRPRANECLTYQFESPENQSTHDRKAFADLIGSCFLNLQREYLNFAYDNISAFSSSRDNQEAGFAAEEGLKDIPDATLAYKFEALQLQRQLRHLHSQFDMLLGQASALIQGRRA